MDYFGEGFDPALLERVPEFALPERKEEVTMQDLGRLLCSLDLTTLAGDDSPERVTELARRAHAPLSSNIVDHLPESPHNHVAAVCVFPAFVRIVRRELSGTEVQTATVAGGFPHGLTHGEAAIAEVEACVRDGAEEIDLVISRYMALQELWKELHVQILMARQRCIGRKLKVILSTGDLGDHELIYRAAMVAMMAGADFVKSSTGKEPVNATPEAAASLLMAIRDYYEKTQRPVGLKMAGGIRTVSDAQQYQELTRNLLGEEWLRPARFRIGASSLLDRILAAMEERTR
jgi:deoxyribose-phosphate aldolase